MLQPICRKHFVLSGHILEVLWRGHSVMSSRVLLLSRETRVPPAHFKAAPVYIFLCSTKTQPKKPPSGTASHAHWHSSHLGQRALRRFRALRSLNCSTHTGRQTTLRPGSLNRGLDLRLTLGLLERQPNTVVQHHSHCTLDSREVKALLVSGVVAPRSATLGCQCPHPPTPTE